MFVEFIVIFLFKFLFCCLVVFVFLEMVLV